jgi:SAM domain (Sterile alpha motif)
MDLGGWLRSLGLERYEASFRENEIDETVLASLTHETLKELGITAARLFRDGLKCPNALFLDGGSASSLYAPTLNYPSNIVPLGPMLAVFETDRGTSRQ